MRPVRAMCVVFLCALSSCSGIRARQNIPILETQYFPQYKIEYDKFSFALSDREYTLEYALYVPLDDLTSHPLVIITHGRNGPHPSRNPREILGYQSLCNSLAQRGYCVMFLVRRGYGNSDGPDSEYRDTAFDAGMAGAQDVEAAVTYMNTMPFVLGDHIAVIGHSQGGWVALASSCLRSHALRGIVNISGATNFRQAEGKSIRSAEVEGGMLKAAGKYGAAARAPALWLYAENDNHLPSTVRKWHNAFEAAGGTGRLVIKPPYRDRGHAFVMEPGVYLRDLLSFFQEIGLNPPKKP